VDTETNKIEIITNTGEHMGGTRLPPEFIAEAGAHIMLCSGPGPRAARMFEEFGIDVFVGASGTVRDLLLHGVVDCLRKLRMRMPAGNIWHKAQYKFQLENQNN